MLLSSSMAFSFEKVYAVACLSLMNTCQKNLGSCASSSSTASVVELYFSTFWMKLSSSVHWCHLNGESSSTRLRNFSLNSVTYSHLSQLSDIHDSASRLHLHFATKTSSE